ncbi:MAG: hypothetical protein MUE60_14165 [Candidatus Eisenbacteria bacterium]|nr:hypothetical protein [Candidatus Eisenbacteria bacterium]
MAKRSSLRFHLTVGMAVAACAMAPVMAIGLSQLQRVERSVKTLTRRHVRQEAFGHRYLVETALARRTSRSFAFLGDSVSAARTREHISAVSALAESLGFDTQDSLVSTSRKLACFFAATFESLAGTSPSFVASLYSFRDHARNELKLRNGELDQLLQHAVHVEPGARDSILLEIQAGLRALDADSLLMRMPIREDTAWWFDARLDTLSRAMTAVGQAVVDRARSGIEKDVADIASLVSRGERNLLGVLLVTAFIAAAWVVYFPRSLQVPLRRFVSSIRRAAEGDLDISFSPSPYRELEDLSQALQQLTRFIARADELRSEKVRVHWRRLQFLARESREYWCITDGVGKPVLMSALLLGRVPDPDRCTLPPAGLSILRERLIDPTDPGQGSVLWLKEIVAEEE